MTSPASAGARTIRWLTYAMFLMFAMTTDSVGVIIPRLIEDYDLGLTAAGAFHYATMAGIALAGLGLGFLADRLGRKTALLLGLGSFGAASLGFLAGDAFMVFVVLLFVSGLAIGVFKTAAIALIGDISATTREHTTTMNLVEGFFGVGAIIGPAIVTLLLAEGLSWKGVYVLAGAMSLVLVLGATLVRYPQPTRLETPPRMSAALGLMRDPYVMGFSTAAMLYVGVETAIYVWMPTFLQGYDGSWTLLAAYALSAFFVLRAAGRFLGAWLLSRLRWTWVLAVCTVLILVCFLGALIGGRDAAVWLLPASGLFMSVIYPTVNSKGVSAYPRSEHGAVAGVILFFTAVSAVVAPLAMGAVSDLFGGPLYGFILATVLAALLAVGAVLNALFDPAGPRLAAAEIAPITDTGGAPLDGPA
jgi:fucose permease